MSTTLQAEGVGIRQRASAKSSSSASASDLTPKKGNVAPAGPPSPSTVYLKLFVFSLLMFIAPLTTYFGTVQRFGSTISGGLAAIMANVVLVGYIIVAFLEPGEAGAPQPKEKKKESKEETKKDT